MITLTGFSKNGILNPNSGCDYPERFSSFLQRWFSIPDHFPCSFPEPYGRCVILAQLRPIVPSGIGRFKGTTCFDQHYPVEMF